jgi:hypothetical protein
MIPPRVDSSGKEDEHTESFESATSAAWCSSIESSHEIGDKLHAAGCRIECACDVGECESLLQHSEFELIVLDVSLNGSEGDGVNSLCSRETGLFRQTPVVFMSVGEEVSEEKNWSRPECWEGAK